MKKTPHSITRQIFIYFGAGAIQGVLAIALIPLATRILGAAEFGVYALLMSIAGLLAAVTEVGTGIVLNGHYFACDGMERKRLLSSIASLSVSVAVILGLLLLAGWPVLSLWVGKKVTLSEFDLILVSASIPLRAVLSVSTQILVIQSRAALSGLTIVLQSIGTFVTTLIALYYVALGQTSLLLGNTAGLAFAAAGALFMLHEDCRALPSATWVKHLLRAAPSSITASLLENARTVLESVTLTRIVGATGLGIYSHARLYYGYLMQVTNAFGYAIWATALKDARHNGNFDSVGKVWDAVYLLITVTGIGFIAVSYELVFVLTHGKFMPAAFWAPFWIAYLLIQNSGKAPTAILYAHHRGGLLARLRVVTILGALPGIVIAIPAFGIAGAVAVAFAEMLAFRLLIQLYARRMRPLPFQDFWAFAGAVLIIALTMGLAGRDFTARALVCAAAMLILLLLRGQLVIEIAGHLYPKIVSRLRAFL